MARLRYDRLSRRTHDSERHAKRGSAKQYEARLDALSAGRRAPFSETGVERWSLQPHWERLHDARCRVAVHMGGMIRTTPRERYWADVNGAPDSISRHEPSSWRH